MTTTTADLRAPAFRMWISYPAGDRAPESVELEWRDEVPPIGHVGILLAQLLGSFEVSTQE